jgi:hypothetical protein
MSLYIANSVAAPFETDGIDFRGENPSCLILTGEEEIPVRITLDPACATKREYRDRCFAGNIAEQVYSVRQGNYGLTWRIGFLEGLRGIRIGACFENRSAEPVRLRKFCLLNGKSAYEGRGGDWWLSTLSHTEQLGSLGDTSPDLQNRKYGDFLTLYRDGGEQGAVFGAVGAPEADITYDVTVNAADFTLSAISWMTDILVEPGQRRNAQELLILFGGSWNIETVIRWNAASLGSRTHKKAPVGWCSWYYYHRMITEETVMSTIKGFQKIKDRIPVDVIQIDDGYQKSYGNWDCNERFPHGFAPLIKEIIAAGAMPGIWLAPLKVWEDAELIREHPEWFQKDRTSGRRLIVDNKSMFIDPTHPGAAAFLRNTVRDKKSLGFTYFKFDFNFLNGDCRYTNPYKTRLQVYRDLYALYREELGDECYLLSCTGMTRGTVGYADASRISADTDPIWVKDKPYCIREGIRGMGTNAMVNGIFYTNDPDVTYLNINDTREYRELTEDERRTWHGFVGLLGGLQFTSEPIEEEPYASSIRQLEILSPPAPEKGRTFCPAAEREHTAFGFTAKRPWGDFASLQLWNNKDVPGGRGLPKREFGPGGVLGFLGDRFHVWSFWDSAYLGLAGADYHTGDLPVHGSRLLRLTPCAGDTPLLVGSTLHISMGAAEIVDVLAGENTFSVRLNPAAGAREGTLYIYSPKPLNCAESEGLTVGTIKNTGQIYEIPVSGRDRQACRQEIRLRL